MYDSDFHKVGIGIASKEQVALIRWPGDKDLLAACRRSGTPRLIIVEGIRKAPASSDILEDWVRLPVSRGDLQTRIAVLEARARRAELPMVKDGSTLQFGDRWIAVSPTEAELLDVLIERFREVVPREALRAQISDRDHDVSQNALDLHIKRLRRRIADLDLSIATVWGRGYVLDLDTGRTPSALLSSPGQGTAGVGGLAKESRCAASI